LTAPLPTVPTALALDSKIDSIRKRLREITQKLREEKDKAAFKLLLDEYDGLLDAQLELYQRLSRLSITGATGLARHK
jgi:uncharacterized membrane-anchored protein